MVNTMKKLKTICLILITLLTLTACGGDKWQESYDLGMRYLSEGNYAEAIIAFDKAIKIDPKQPMAYVGRADAHIGSGETDDNLALAFADYTAAIELDETNANAWLGLADVYIRQGEFDKAMETLQEALVKTNNADIIANKLAEIEAGNFTDSSGNIRRSNSFDAYGNLKHYHIYFYDEKNRLSMATSFKANGEQTGHAEAVYNEAGQAIIDIYMTSDTVGLIECVYDEHGNLIHERFINSVYAGQETMYEYDEQGNETKRIFYEKGEINSWVESEYKSNVLVKECIFFSDGSLIGYIEHEYDDKMRRVKDLEYAANGELERYIVYRFDASDNYLGMEFYDGDGNMTGYDTW